MSELDIVYGGLCCIYEIDSMQSTLNFPWGNNKIASDVIMEQWVNYG